MQNTPPRPVGAPVAGFAPPPTPGPAQLDGRTVRLARLTADHAAPLFAAVAGQDWVWDYLGYGPFAAAADYADWARQAAGQADPCFYALLPHDRALPRVGGIAAYLRITPAHGTLEIGHILIAPALQRTTPASEAIMLMVRWALDAGYRRVEWKCDALNAPSRAAARRYGFRFEGVFARHMVVKGRNRDTAWFAMTQDDWPQVRAAWDAWLDPANFDGAGRQHRPLAVPQAACGP